MRRGSWPCSVCTLCVFVGKKENRGLCCVQMCGGGENGYYGKE